MTALTRCPVSDRDLVRCIRPVQVAHNAHEGWDDHGTLRRWETGEALIQSTRGAFEKAREAYLTAVRSHLASIVSSRIPSARYLGVDVSLIQGSRGGESMLSVAVRSAYAATRLCDCGCAPRCTGACPCGGRSAEDAALIVADAESGELDEGWIDVLAEFDTPAPDEHRTYAYDLTTGEWRTDVHLSNEGDDDDDE